MRVLDISYRSHKHSVWASSFSENNAKPNPLKMTIGIYHAFVANRKAILKELEDYSGFHFLEIDHWKKMETILADIIVVCSPEFLPSCVSVTQFKNFLNKLNKTLIIIAYDVNVWTMERNNTYYLKEPDKPKTTSDLITILTLEKVGTPNKHFFKQRVSFRDG